MLFLSTLLTSAAVIPGWPPLSRLLPGVPRAELASVTPAPSVEDQPALSAAPLGRPLVLDRGVDGLFHVTASINGAPVDLIVDTGASFIVLSGRDARRAGVIASGEDRPLLTANGTTGMRWAMVDQVALGSRTAKNLCAAVVATSDQPSLLGLNALAVLGPVQLRDGQLILG